MWYQRVDPPNPPGIHGSIDREGIDQEKECLLNTVSNNRPPPKSPPINFYIFQDQ